MKKPIHRLMYQLIAHTAKNRENYNGKSCFEYHQNSDNILNI